MTISISSDAPFINVEEVNLDEMNSSMYLDAMNQLHKKFEENERIVNNYKKYTQELKIFFIHMFGLLKQMDKIADNSELEPNFHFLFESILYAFENKIYEIIN